VGKKIRCIGTIDRIKQHHHPDDNKNIAHHPSGQLDSDQNPDHSDEHIERCLGTGAVVDDFKIEDPVADAEDRKEDQQIVNDPQPFVFGFIEQKDENVSDDNVYSAVILGGCGL
jgi:hypothetical protein